MTPHPFSEKELVEQAVLEVLAALGWATGSGTYETFGSTGTLGRVDDREVVLKPRLRTTLARLNSDAATEAIEAALDVAVDELTRDRTAMDPAAASREVHRLLLDGITVSTRDVATGREEVRTLRVVDWENPQRNDWLAARQVAFRGVLYRCIPDIVLFVNGLPWVLIEVKKPNVPARRAFDDNLSSYRHPQNGVPALLAFNAFLVASNGTESRVGSLTADWDRFFEWKRIAREDEPRTVSLETLLRGTCDPARLLDLVRNFTLFSEHKAGLVKILAQNHQALGVNNAIEATLAARRAGHGRAGVFWHTQGSGKSFSMVFYAQKILRTLPGNWTFVVVTDRVELDDQIARTFAACGAAEDATACHATSGAELRRLLAENHRYVFTLIHKFSPALADARPGTGPSRGPAASLGDQTREVLCDRPDVIVLVDEAHRTQYDTLALNMRAALPRAQFVAFTGTPLLAGEERTREVFGDYVSIYDFQQSAEDGATVPLFYENRTPELRLTNPDLNDEIYAAIDEAALDEEGEARLDRLLGQRYHLLTRDDRLDVVAGDIVRHFLDRGFQGKAMVVSIDKATALRTHDKVQRAWAAETDRVRAALEQLPLDASQEELGGLRERLRRLETVDMALVVSPGQNEIEEMKALGLDIVPHRKRMVESNPPLDERFKDPADPLEIVFVCAMWITGFDVPSCSTVYLDKPMRNHTLMQTIARANRVYPGKHSGTIVDYANVFASLEKALALYGAGKSRGTPVRDKDELAAELQNALAEIDRFCKAAGVDLSAIEAASSAIARLTLVGQAVNALVEPEERRKTFLAHARYANAVYTALKPHTKAIQFASRMAAVALLAEKIRTETTPGGADVTDVLRRIGEVLDRSIEGVDVREGHAPLDLSGIDFEALAARFKDSPTKNLDLERLKAAIRAQLDRLIEKNETRVDFREKFERLIEDYNAGSLTIEEIFRELLNLSRSLGEEQDRHVREQLTEEELVVFDLLTRPGPELSTDERAEVKRVARQLLARLREILSLDWQRTALARARVKEAIEATLDDGLPRAYTPEVFKDKAGVVFRHVVERYGRAA